MGMVQVPCLFTGLCSASYIVALSLNNLVQRINDTKNKDS